VNDPVDTCDGVPVSNPELDNDIPAGNDPDVTEYENGAVPATDHNCCEYA
jgi:hypothetical protein